MHDKDPSLRPQEQRQGTVRAIIRSMLDAAPTLTLTPPPLRRTPLRPEEEDWTRTEEAWAETGDDMRAVFRDLGMEE